MTITKTITLYSYDELPTEKAKANARAWYDGLNFDWYQNTYEDAEQAGIVIKGFDLDGFIEIAFKVSDTETAEHILKHHGEDCDTYKASKTWEKAIDALPEPPAEDEPSYHEVERALCEGRDVAESEFNIALGKAYVTMLKAEYDHQSDPETIADNLRCNDYTFRENGEREDA